MVGLQKVFEIKKQNHREADGFCFYKNLIFEKLTNIFKIMRIATIIIRLLLGALMLFASIAYFFDLMDEQPQAGAMATVMAGFAASKYLFPLVKVIELLAGISLVTGKFMKISLLVLLPISVNIFLIHAFLQPKDLLMGGFPLVANIFLIYTNWNSYKHLFTA